MAQAARPSCPKHCAEGVQLPLLGKVLVTEGSNGTAQLVSSELYSPLLNIWTPAGNQQVTRTGFTNNPNNDQHAQVPNHNVLSPIMSRSLIISFLFSLVKCLTECVIVTELKTCAWC